MYREITRVLVADDDPLFTSLLHSALEGAGYHVSVVDNGHTALSAARHTLFDLFILDVTMPVMDGLEACRRIRDASTAPIIMVTGRNTEADVIRGLDAGADDYLVKPFSPGELLARVRARLRRTGLAAPRRSQVVRTGRLEIDPAQYRVRLDDRELALTPLERRLLSHFARYIERVLEADHILTHVWGPTYTGDAGLLQVAISRLRQKIEPDPAHPTYIQTLPGIGYLLAAVDGL